VLNVVALKSRAKKCFIWLGTGVVCQDGRFLTPTWICDQYSNCYESSDDWICVYYDIFVVQQLPQYMKSNTGRSDLQPKQNWHLLVPRTSLRTSPICSKRTSYWFHVMHLLTLGLILTMVSVFTNFFYDYLAIKKTKQTVFCRLFNYKKQHHNLLNKAPLLKKCLKKFFLEQLNFSGATTLRMMALSITTLSLIATLSWIY